MTRSNSKVAALLVTLVVLSKCTLSHAQEAELAQPATDGSTETNVEAQATLAPEASGTEGQDWSSYAKTLPMFGPDLKAGQAMLFNLSNGKLLASYRRYGDHLRHVRFSPDGNHALLSFYDVSVLWNLNTGEAEREFPRGGIAHFAPDGSTVLIYGEIDAECYEVATGNLVETIRLVSAGRGLKSRDSKINAHLPNEEQYDASGALLYNTEASSYQPILDAATGKEVGLCPSSIDGCFVSGATQKVLQAGPLRPFDVLRIFDFNRKEIARVDMPPSELPGISGQLKAVSSDGKQFLYARPTKEVGENPGPMAQYRTMRYSVHDATTGEELKALGNFDTGYNARFSPSGRLVVLLPTFGDKHDDLRDPEILVINVATAAVQHRIYSGPWALPSIDFDETGNRLLVAGAINLRFWRRTYEWRQLEQQSPMPRKVIDTLKIIKDRQTNQQAELSEGPG
jgi:hypothetical protein